MKIPTNLNSAESRKSTIMKKITELKGLILGFLFTISLVTWCSTATAIPIEQSSPSINSTGDVIESVGRWKFSNGLKPVIEDLKNGDKRTAKLKLARFLTIHKDDPGALSLAGVILFDEHNYVAAEDSFNRLIKQGVKTSEIYALAGVSAQMQGKNVVAKRNLDTALDVNPEQTLALQYLGRIAMGNNQYQEAASYFRRMLNTPAYKDLKFSKAHLEFVDSLILAQQAEKAVKVLSVKNIPDDLQFAHTLALARTYVSLGNVSKGLSVLDKTSVISSEKLFLSLEKIRILAQTGQPDRALQLTDSLIEKNPEARARLYFDRGLILANQKKFAAAAESVLNSAEFAEENEQPLISIQASSFLTKAGDMKSAKNLLKKALKKHPNNLAIKYELASLLSQSTSLKQATKLLDEILAEKDDYFLAHYLRGVIAWNLKQIPKALLHFNAAVNINPQYVDGWLALSEVEHIRSNDQKMREMLERGLKNNPGNPALRYQLASQAFATRDYERAMRFLKNFPETSRSYGNAQSLMILILIDQNKPTEEIRETIDRAKVISPKNIYLKDAEGYFLARNGKPKEAINILRRTATTAKNDAVVYLHLSEALLINGNKIAAKDALKKAIKLGNASENEKFTIDRLKAQLHY